MALWTRFELYTVFHLASSRRFISHAFQPDHVNTGVSPRVLDALGPPLASLANKAVMIRAMTIEFILYLLLCVSVGIDLTRGFSENPPMTFLPAPDL